MGKQMWIYSFVQKEIKYKLDTEDTAVYRGWVWMGWEEGRIRNGGGVEKEGEEMTFSKYSSNF